MNIFRRTFSLICIMALLMPALQADEWHWARQMGDFHNDVGWDNAVDANGNNYVAGYFQGNISFGSTVLTSEGGYDGYVAKYNSDGDALWAVRVGGVDYDKVTSVDLDAAGNAYITGFFTEESATFQSFIGDDTVLYTKSSQDVYVAKYSAQGELLWVKQVGHEEEPGDYFVSFANNVAVDEEGNAHIVGRFWKETELDGVHLVADYYGDAFFAKYNTDGELQWAKQTHTSYDGRGYGIALDHEGNVFVNGDFKENLVYPDTTFVCHDGTGNEDVWVAKYNADGEYQWARHIGGFSEDITWNLSVDGEGNCYTLTHFLFDVTVGDKTFQSQGSTFYDMILAKYDADGNFQWARHDGGPSQDTPYFINTTDDGTSFVTGFFQATASFGDTILSSYSQSDGFISIYNSNGDFKKVLHIKGRDSETVHSLETDASGSHYIYGFFMDTIYIGNQYFVSFGNGDAFAAKLDIDIPSDPAVLAGTVTDAENGEPVDGAEITAGSAEAITEEDGSYSMSLAPGEYTVNCSATGYASAQNTITVVSGQTNTLDFGLEPLNLPVPDGLMAEVFDNNNVQLNWNEPPAPPQSVELYHDDGSAENMLDLNPPSGNERLAVSYTQEQAVALDSIKMYVSAQTNFGQDITYHVLGDNNGMPDSDNVLGGPYTVNYTPEMLGEPEWLTFDIADLDIPAGETFYIQVEWTTSNNFKVGADVNDIDPYSFFSMDAGTNWMPAEQFDIMIRAIVLSPAKENTRDLLGYNIYRNEEKINESPVSETSYQDTGLENGMYGYYVTALYDAGESTASNTAEVEINYVPGMNAPTNFAAEIYGEKNVALSWEAPATPGGDPLELYWDDGSAEDMLNIGNPNGSEMLAVGFMHENELCLDSIKLYISAQSNFAQEITFYVVGEDNGEPDEEDVLGGPYVTDYTPEMLGEPEWHTFDIEDLQIPANTLFFIESTFTTDNNYKVGIDANDPDPYSFATMDGSNWMQAPDLDIMMRALVLTETSKNKELLGYNVYRNGTMLNEDPLAETLYNDVSLQSGTYSYQATAVYEAGESAPTEAVEVAINKHFAFGGGNPADPVWTVYLPMATLDGADLQPGDELAMYDGETMVGMFELNEVLTPENQLDNYITAFSTLSNSDGYTPGNPVSLKCWDASEQTEISYAGMNFLNPYGDAWTEPVFPDTDGEYSLVELEFLTSITQNISISSGYQFVSSGVEPASPDMSVVLESIVGNGSLDFVRNSAGDMFHKIGPEWVNNIGDWQKTEGYLFRLLQDDELAITGLPVDPQTPIDLYEGYQFISYLPDSPADAQMAVENILDNLEFLRSSNGSMLHKVGGNWVNNIGDMLPGEGYLARMNAADQLIYNINAKSAGKGQPTASTYFDFEGGNAADPVYTIYLEPGKAINAGDEVAAYAGSKMVGSVTVRSDKFTENAMAVFSTLNSGKGYQAGEAIELKLYDRSENKVIDLAYEMNAPYGEAYTGNTYPKGDGVFSIASLSTLLTGVDTNNGLEFTLYPNPASERVVIESAAQSALLTITAANGQLMLEKRISNERNTIDISKLTAGIYTIRLITDNQTNTHKLIVR